MAFGNFGGMMGGAVGRPQVGGTMGRGIDMPIAPAMSKVSGGAAMMPGSSGIFEQLMARAKAPVQGGQGGLPADAPPPGSTTPMGGGGMGAMMGQGRGAGGVLAGMGGYDKASPAMPIDWRSGLGGGGALSGGPEQPPLIPTPQMNPIPQQDSAEELLRKQPYRTPDEIREAGGR